MDLAYIYKKFQNSTGICTDTRKIKENEMFYSLSGPNFNGNAYARQALEKGASCVVVDDLQYFTQDDKYILVDDCLDSLQQLACYHRQNLKNTTVIALTGSNGKTTTKELIYSVLSQKFSTYCTQGNLNNHIGVPLTLLNCDQDHEFLILEMGANHQGEIASLCEFGLPDFGLITNIGKAHLEGFGGLEGVKKGKSELYKHLTRNHKNIFINIDNAILTTLTPENSKLIEYKSTDLNIIKYTPYLTLERKGEFITTQLTGTYNIENIATAIAVGEYFGLTQNQIAQGINKYTPESNRSQIVQLDSNKIFLDAYNANPTSMKASLDNFIQINEPNNSILILGDMLELGNESEKEHMLILNHLTNFEGEIYTVGKHFYSANKVNSIANAFQTYEELEKVLDLSRIKNKTIFLKGSRGIGLERLIKRS